jgi:hypothetical protein
MRWNEEITTNAKVMSNLLGTLGFGVVVVKWLRSNQLTITTLIPGEPPSPGL